MPDPEVSFRQRFLKTMACQAGVRIPLWADGIADETWEAWRPQGIGSLEVLRQRFGLDRHELLELKLVPMPPFSPGATASLAPLRLHYQPDVAERIPRELGSLAASETNRDFPLGATMSRGLLLTCGIRDWRDLTTVLYAFHDQPEEIHSNLIGKVRPDFAVFSEPIASFHGPVVSPACYRRFCLDPYRRLIERLKGCGVKTLVVRTWGRGWPLVPQWLELGFNALWNDHCHAGGTDYPTIRREFGRDLRLLGGIDSRALYRDRQAIDRALESTVPPILETGGYLPWLDDRVRPHVPLAHYAYYRERLSRLMENG
jgi:hypothetical protein